VLDKKFLSNLTNPSDAYRKWLEKNAVFTHGGVQETHTIDVKQAGLGSSDIRVEGGAIVGRFSSIPRVTVLSWGWRAEISRYLCTPVSTHFVI